MDKAVEAEGHRHNAEHATLEMAPGPFCAHRRQKIAMPCEIGDDRDHRESRPVERDLPRLNVCPCGLDAGLHHHEDHYGKYLEGDPAQGMSRFSVHSRTRGCVAVSMADSGRKQLARSIS